MRWLLQNRFVRVVIRLSLGLTALATVLFTGAAIYNAFDEDLSPQAKALLAPSPMGKIDDRNGYIAFLGLVAPKGQDQLAWGRKAAQAFVAQGQPDFVANAQWKDAIRVHFKVNGRALCRFDCLTEANQDAQRVTQRLADDDNAQLLARYRQVRDAPEFADLYLGALALNTPSAYTALSSAASLSLSDAALKAKAGDLGLVVAELEREVAFHRQMIAGGHLMVTVMSGETLLARDLLTISELQRLAGDRLTPYYARLSALTRPQVNASALQAAFRQAAHEKASWAHYWRRFLQDSSRFTNTQSVADSLEFRLMSYFIQPNASANLIAQFMTAESALATVPAAQFDQALADIRSNNQALLDRPWYGEWRNPVGKGVAELAAVDLGKYAARMNDLQALAQMVDLQLTLAARGLHDPAAIAAFIASEGAVSHPDPYTGKAFAYDPATRLLSFKSRAKDRWSDELMKRHGGKVALAL